MSWRATRCMHPGVVWERYAGALGLEKLRATFGENWPPKEARALEEVYVVRDDAASPRPFDPSDHPAAWISLAKDQFDPTSCHMSRGVWPDQHGNGLGRWMRAFAEEWCRANGCDSLHISVFVVNWQHLARVMEDDYWDIEGAIFEPAGFNFQHVIETPEHDARV